MENTIGRGGVQPRSPHAVTPNNTVMIKGLKKLKGNEIVGGSPIQDVVTPQK